MTSAVYFEKKLQWWTKPFYIVIEAVGGTLACQCVRATAYNCKNGPYDSKVFFFLDGIISFSQGHSTLAVTLYPSCLWTKAGSSMLQGPM